MTHKTLLLSIVGVFGLVIVAFIFAVLPPHETIDIDQSKIGLANLVWKIQFQDQNTQDFDDIIDGMQMGSLTIDDVKKLKTNFNNWLHANELNSALCKKVFTKKVDQLYRTGSKKAKLMSIWNGHDDLFDACTTEYIREIDNNIQLESICYSQVYFLLDILQVENDPLKIRSNLHELLHTAFAASLMFPRNIERGILDVIINSGASIYNQSQAICNINSGKDMRIITNEGHSVLLEFDNLAPINVDLVVNLQEALSKVGHIASTTSSPHNADLIVVLSESKYQGDVLRWSNSHFDWTKETSPVKSLHVIANTGQVLTILDTLYSKELSVYEQLPRILFVVEAIEHLETIRQFMVKFLTVGDLEAGHWIYFFPSEHIMYEERTAITSYLVNNAWTDVHWVDNLDDSNKTSNKQIGVIPRFYGLRRKTPSGSSMVVHVKRGNMHPIDIPVSFDYRKKSNADCLYPVIGQGFCGSCWAIAAGEMISSAKCIVSRAEYSHPISTQDILSCVEADSYGCKGAYMSDALLTARNSGFVNESCTPYYNDDCYDLSLHGYTCSVEVLQGLRIAPTASCKSTCEDGTAKQRRKVVKDIYWLNSGTNGRTSPSETAKLTQEYIMTRGPVIAGIAVYPDFEDYDAANEIYIHKHDPTQRLLGGHAILLVGWGTETLPSGRNVDYWIAKNSWGEDWGDNGYFRMLRGQGGVPYVEDEIYSLELDKRQLFY